ELWRKNLPGEFDDHYAGNDHRTLLADLNGDRRSEVLFLHTMRRESSVLRCFSPDGDELWHFTVGRPVHTANATFAPPYWVHKFLVLPDKEPRIVISSFHHLYYPAQVVVLSGSGKLVGEYWHAGHLPVVEFADLDHDGKSEIYVAGVNNARRAAT